MLATPHMVIADDDRAFRETLASVFVAQGFRTTLAIDGEEVLGIARREPVHLMLLDYEMPRLTGLEAVRQMQRRSRKLPWILISAAIDEALRAEAQRADAFCVLDKPVRFRELNSAVETAMKVNYDWSPSN
jgi:DNA-binding response OmpR family regulator